MPNSYVLARNSLVEALNHHHERCDMPWREIAALEQFQGVSHITLWKIANDPGYRPSRDIAERLGLPLERCRLAADVSPEQRQTLQDFAALMGMSWTEYCRWFADGVGEFRKVK